jgi:predicted nucleotidyltransferase
MMRVDPLVLAALSALVRGLRALEIEFCIIGALVPELLLGIPPRRLTNDADATVVLDSLADFEDLKARLVEFGFDPTRLPYRLTHREGGWVDLLPYSRTLAPPDISTWRAICHSTWWVSTRSSRTPLRCQSRRT